MYFMSNAIYTANSSVFLSPLQSVYKLFNLDYIKTVILTTVNKVSEKDLEIESLGF